MPRSARSLSRCKRPLLATGSTAGQKAGQAWKTQPLRYCSPQDVGEIVWDALMVGRHGYNCGYLPDGAVRPPSHGVRPPSHALGENVC